ncbi:unnamed protein product [Heligmosomoides polygyrus]|uniref:Uncharacterized protein n=1 Tax=Heligmosomoides polygyrus TaxID=6339 RepID=A0A183FMY4_HELPZ|nr:unnamed protein product [Heligmosomoides polygyrus]
MASYYECAATRGPYFRRRAEAAEQRQKRLSGFVCEEAVGSSPCALSPSSSCLPYFAIELEPSESKRRGRPSNEGPPLVSQLADDDLCLGGW